MTRRSCSGIARAIDDPKSSLEELYQLLLDQGADWMLLTQFDGYPTGVAVSPDLIRLSTWLRPTWAGDDGEGVPNFDDLPGVAKRRKAFINAALKGIDRNDKKSKVGSFHVYYLVDPKTGKIDRHCYVHAKTWVFDDEMAIIGSANCNRRGLSSDSEANVCVFDAPASGDCIAKALGKRLWREHLGLKADVDIDDAVKSLDLWQQKRPTSRVREYDPDKA